MTAPTKHVHSLCSTIRLLVAGISGVLLGVSAFRLTGSAKPPAHLEGTASSDLSVAAEHLNFGETWESTRFAWVLPIENRQDKDVRIQGFYVSCTCLKAESLAEVAEGAAYLNGIRVDKGRRRVPA